MKIFLTTALLATLASAATADAGYSDHKGVRLFTDLPCGAVVSVIDEDFDVETHIELVGIQDAMGEFGAAIARKNMAWGFILGYDTANGGLHEGGKTTLTRLRESCDAQPNMTAMEILTGFQ